LRDGFLRHIEANDVEAYVLFRELDYFEQLGAMEEHGGFDFALIEALLGQKLVDRFDLWTPSIEAIGGRAVYPNFTNLAEKMRAALN
jgi:hypothetical protein